MNKSIILSVAILIAIFVTIVALTEVPKKHTFLENSTEVVQQTSGDTTEN